MRITHTIKGAAGTLGLTQLQAVTRALEENLLRQDGKGEVDEVSILTAAVNAVQQNFHAVLETIVEQAGAGITVKRERVRRYTVHLDPSALQDKNG